MDEDEEVLTKFKADYKDKNLSEEKNKGNAVLFFLFFF